MDTTACGFTGLAAGYAIGIVGDAVCRAIYPTSGKIAANMGNSVCAHTFMSQRCLFQWFLYLSLPKLS